MVGPPYWAPSNSATTRHDGVGRRHQRVGRRRCTPAARRTGHHGEDVAASVRGRGSRRDSGRAPRAGPSQAAWPATIITAATEPDSEEGRERRWHGDEARGRPPRRSEDGHRSATKRRRPPGLGQRRGARWRRPRPVRRPTRVRFRWRPNVGGGARGSAERQHLLALHPRCRSAPSASAVSAASQVPARPRPAPAAPALGGARPDRLVSSAAGASPTKVRASTRARSSASVVRMASRPSTAAWRTVVPRPLAVSAARTATCSGR